MFTAVEPTSTTAYIYYGMINPDRLLICCYHSSQMTSLAYYAEYTKELNNGKGLPNKSSPKTLRKVPIKDSSDYDLIEQSILTALQNIKVQVEEFKKVAFYADVNLCFLDKFEIARFLMDDTLPAIFQVPLDCVLETSLVEVAKKAANYHKEHYTSKVTIRTKQEGSGCVYSYPECLLPEIDHTSDVKNAVDTNSTHSTLSVPNITLKDGPSCVIPDFQKIKRVKEDLSKTEEHTVCGKKHLSKVKESTGQISSIRDLEVQEVIHTEQVYLDTKISYRTLIEANKITEISQPDNKYVEIENQLNHLNKRKRFDSFEKDANNLDSAALKKR